MRFVAIVVFWLAGAIASAAAQSRLPPADPTPPATQQTSPLVQQVTAQSDVRPVEAPVIPTVALVDAKPTEAVATQPEVKPIVSQPLAQPLALPVETTPAQPAAEPPAQKAAQPPALEAAADCPGNPDALGTSRVLTINPGEFTLLGTIQYKQTLPLKDHEVVLTFDDGPIPPYTTSVLDTLASQCVKATYFLVGEMAQARPYLVRRIYNEGHSIGTHSQDHPYAFQRLSMQRVEREIDGGINSVTAALGDAKALSPFFRIPGFGRTNAIEQFLEGKQLVTWSADVDTDDWWRGSSPGAIVQRAMRRLNEKGRGIILMHDIHPATALALPILLKELKANGYHVVHVVAAGEQPKSLPEVVATPAEKEAWPRLPQAETQKGGLAKSARRHRVKLALAHRRHHRGARRHDGDKIDHATSSSLDRRLTHSY